MRGAETSVCRSRRGRGHRSPSDAGHPQRGHTQAGNLSEDYQTPLMAIMGRV